MFPIDSTEILGQGEFLMALKFGDRVSRVPHVTATVKEKETRPSGMFVRAVTADGKDCTFYEHAGCDFEPVVGYGVGFAQVPITYNLQKGDEVVVRARGASHKEYYGTYQDYLSVLYAGNPHRAAEVFRRFQA